jgi:hypothetical protein
VKLKVGEHRTKVALSAPGISCEQRKPTMRRWRHQFSGRRTSINRGNPSVKVGVTGLEEPLVCFDGFAKVYKCRGDGVLILSSHCLPLGPARSRADWKSVQVFTVWQGTEEGGVFGSQYLIARNVPHGIGSR